jgi:hypothetical protein
VSASVLAVELLGIAGLLTLIACAKFRDRRST